MLAGDAVAHRVEQIVLLRVRPFGRAKLAGEACCSRHPAPPERAPGRVNLRAISRVSREKGWGTRHVLEDLAEREGLSLDDLKIFPVLPRNEAVREAVESAGAIAAGRLRAQSTCRPRDFTWCATATGT